VSGLRSVRGAPAPGGKEWQGSKDDESANDGSPLPLLWAQPAAQHRLSEAPPRECGVPREGGEAGGIFGRAAGDPHAMSEQNRGHVWRTDSDGSRHYHEPIDGHGGPVCVLCDYWYCEHCHPEGPPEACEAQVVAGAPREAGEERSGG
jgi:hypothetical protein